MTMKTNLLFLLFAAITLLACNKEKLTNDTDITQSSWKLKCIAVGKEKYKDELKKDDYHRPAPYVLAFESDSTFVLDTSKNHARGFFSIPEKGKIEIKFYGSRTEVGGENDFDEKMLRYFSTVTDYELITRNKLKFYAEGCELEFVKQ